jgi:hypothetical protein
VCSVCVADAGRAELWSSGADHAQVWSPRYVQVSPVNTISFSIYKSNLMIDLLLAALDFLIFMQILGDHWYQYDIKIGTVTHCNLSRIYCISEEKN